MRRASRDRKETKRDHFILCSRNKRHYLISSNSPSGGMKEMLRSLSNLLNLTHWWNVQSSIAILFVFLEGSRFLESTTKCSRHINENRSIKFHNHYNIRTWQHQLKNLANSFPNNLLPSDFRAAVFILIISHNLVVHPKLALGHAGEVGSHHHST